MGISNVATSAVLPLAIAALVVAILWIVGSRADPGTNKHDLQRRTILTVCGSGFLLLSLLFAFSMSFTERGADGYGVLFMLSSAAAGAVALWRARR